MRHYLLITIDTEEDLWSGYSIKNPPVENIKKIYLLQEIFEKYNATPTYLIDYPVATDPYSIELFGDLLKNGKCDIGSHCHPWNNPPFADGGDIEYNTFLCNLPDDLVYEKIIQLHNKIILNLKFAPIAFRAGRWGVGENVIKSIKKIGYKIDTSITPFVSWEEYYGPKLYMKSNKTVGIERLEEICDKAENCNDCAIKDNCIVELPPTIGFFQSNFKLCHDMRTLFMNKYFKHFHLIGALDRLGLLNFRVLSPETSTFEDMIKLSKAIMNNGNRFINMTFHSTSLLPGMSPFVRNKKELELFLGKIDRYLEFMTRENVQCIGISRAMEVLS